ncbi:hypothetical protein V1527DRAFT_519578 [Lipomyces starkeyi]
MPFHRLAIRVPDVKRSREFYDPVLSAVGYVVYFALDSIAYYAPASNPKAIEFGLILANPSKSAATSRVAKVSGGKDNGHPGIREKINKGYYGAFVLDPDGNN